jgi:hyaluronate lyase
LANFWTADAPKTAGIALSDRGSIVLSRQGDDLKVAVSDPTRKLDTLTVTLDRTASAVIATDPGVQVLATSPQISFSVNLSGHTGDTFVAHFRQA